MNAIATSTLTKFVILASVLCALSARAGSGVFTPSDDAYVEAGDPDDNFGAADNLHAKYRGPSNATTRKVAIEFDTGVSDLSQYGSVSLKLVVSSFGDGESSDFNVFGVKDWADHEDFDEAAVTYNTFTPLFDDSQPYGVNTNDTTNLYDPVPGGSVEPILTFHLDDPADGYEVTLTSEELVAYAHASANSRLTFIITRAENSNSWAASESSLLLLRSSRSRWARCSGPA